MNTDSVIDSRAVCGATIVINMRIKHVLQLLDFLRGKHCLFYFCGVPIYNYNTSKIPVRWPCQCYGFKLSLIFKYCGGIGLY